MWDRRYLRPIILFSPLYSMHDGGALYYGEILSHWRLGDEDIIRHINCSNEKRFFNLKERVVQELFPASVFSGNAIKAFWPMSDKTCEPTRHFPPPQQGRKNLLFLAANQSKG